MNPLQEACFAFTTSNNENVQSLFSLLVSSYQVENGEKEDKSEELTNFLKTDFPTKQSRAIMSDLFAEFKYLRSDFLHTIFSKKSETNLLNDLAIELIKEVSHNVNVGIHRNTGYGSKKSLLTLAISTCYEPLFNEVAKCRFDINATDKKPKPQNQTYMIKTLFSEATKEASKHSGKDNNANYALHFLLEQQFANTGSDIYADQIKSLSEQDDAEQIELLKCAQEATIKINRGAILNLLCGDLYAAKICSDHGYYLNEYQDESTFSHDTNYAESTIKHVIRGFISQVDLESGKIEREYEEKLANENVRELRKIESVLFHPNAKQEKYLNPLFDHEFIMNVINDDLKEASRNYNSGRGFNTKEKYSRTLDFFERLLERESLLWDDSEHATRTLFALSKTNYAGYLVDHYLKKMGMEKLASSATGVEQAKFIINTFSSDPITVASLIKKESVKNQLIANLTSL